MSKIKGKLWGYNKQEVDEYIEKIVNIQSIELDELSKKSESCEQENEILRKKLTSLKDIKTSLPSGNLLEFALKRIERVLEFMDQDVSNDVQALDNISQQKTLALKNNIAQIDKEIEKEKNVIEKELNKIAEIVKAQERTKNINIDVIKNLGKVLPIADWVKSTKEDLSEFENTFGGDELKSRTKELIEKITSDGTTITSPQKPDTTNPNSNLSGVKANNMEGSREENASSRVMKEDTVDKSIEHKDAKIDKFILEDKPYTSGINDTLEQPLVENEDQYWNSFFDSDKKVNVSTEEVAVTEDPFKKSSSSEIKSQAISDDLSQAGVRQEISAVRSKYVLGKLVGEDITDNSGQVIIRKDDPITVEVMELAQKEGKLADLIIHMVIPGQEE